MILDLVEVGELRSLRTRASGLNLFLPRILDCAPAAFLRQSLLAWAEHLVAGRLLLIIIKHLEARALVTEPEVDFILGHSMHLKDHPVVERKHIMGSSRQVLDQVSHDGLIDGLGIPLTLLQQRGRLRDNLLLT
jgi:hypothetical protein